RRRKDALLLRRRQRCFVFSYCSVADMAGMPLGRLIEAIGIRLGAEFALLLQIADLLLHRVAGKRTLDARALPRLQPNTKNLRDPVDARTLLRESGFVAKQAYFFLIGKFDCARALPFDLGQRALERVAEAL